METFALKPISKRALVRCIEQEYCGGEPEALANAIEAEKFSGVLIGPGPDGELYTKPKTKITTKAVKEYKTYCGHAIRAAIFAVLGDDAEQRFPYLDFPSSVQLDQES